MSDKPFELPPAQLSGYDHAPRFVALEQNQEEISVLLGQLLGVHEPQPLSVEDPERRLLVTDEEISRIWGLFPASARERAQPNPPIVKSGTPRWFAHGSSSRGPIITDKLEEALSLTAHGLAHTEPDGSIIMHEIPENGFSNQTKRLVQVGVLVHELAHTIANPDLNERDPERILLFPTGNTISAVDWIIQFGQIAERHSPISRYSAAYRNADGRFPQENGTYLGTPILEELVDSITAKLLGYVVDNNGLNRTPFKDKAEIQNSVQEYLNARLVITN